MTRDDDKLEQQVQRAWPELDAGRAPSFAAAWAAAERRYAQGRRRTRVYAGAAAVVAAVVVGLVMQAPPVEEAAYVEIDELMSSTSWSAPSDVLLPEHQFDIYQEVPSLLESTESAGGSLL